MKKCVELLQFKSSSQFFSKNINFYYIIPVDFVHTIRLKEFSINERGAMAEWLEQLGYGAESPVRS